MRRGGDSGMTVTWVALLRGVNVGRNKRIAMADLRTMLEALGSGDVRTLGQSGNLVFTAAQRRAEPLEQEISKGIRATFGMDVAVLLRTADDFAAAVDANPFVASGVDATELHAAFLSAEPAAATSAGIDHAAFLPDEFAFGKRVVYVRLPNGVMGATLPDWDKVLGVRATQRNWNTTTKLRELIR
jgi:uncharacterized protein (DUF1697 family)